MHSDDEVRSWFRDVVVPRLETWVACRDGAVVGLMVLDDDRLEQLYLDPGCRGQGIGDEFVALAKRLRPRLRLRCFQANGSALRFYRRHGFVEVERTDGDNEEQEPDVLLIWRHASTSNAAPDTTITPPRT